MPSAIDLLTEWLADGSNKRCVFIEPWLRDDWRCGVVVDNRSYYVGFGPTPDAAIRAAIEKARRG